MLGLFKRMLSRTEAPKPAPPVRSASVARPAPLPPPRPKAAAPVAAPTSPSSVRVTAIAPKVSPPSVAAVAVAPVSVPSAPPPATNGYVQVALAVIAANLPESLQHKVPARGDQFVAIPVNLILPQLSQGQVVLTTSQLRECAPDYFVALAGVEDVAVALPLADIVKQLLPEHFARRSRRTVEVPAEIAPVFTAGGQGAAVVTPAATQPTPAYRAQPSVTTTSAQSAPVAASKISVSAQALAAMKAATSNPVAPRPAAPTPRAITPTPAPAPAPQPRKTFPLAPKLTGDLAVPLAAVCHEWVQEVRHQLTGVEAEQHQILVPIDLLEPAMKSGKVLFSWQEVATWIQPPLAQAPSPKVGEMMVDLPLKVIAPLFMALHRGGGQKRVAVDESIPDLFNGGNGNGQANGVGAVPSQVPCAPRPSFTPPAARQMAPTPASAPASAPVAAVRMVSTPLPKIETPAASDEVPLEQVIGNGTGHFPPKEIVANAAKLPGVSGALLVMSDGLLVTSNTPPAVKAETIAAFLPQMFGRMNQYTKELALGPLQQLTLGIEDGSWHVIKAPNIYFAVLGKRGETLPLNLLAQIAAELSNQSK